MIAPWQALAIYIVIAVVILFLIILFFGKSDDEDDFQYLFAIIWPLSLTVVAFCAAFFVVFVLPARAAAYAHKKTTPPEAP